MRSQPGNILLSSAGRRGELVQILRAALHESGGGEVHTTDMSPLTSAGWLSDRLVLMPRVSQPSFIDKVIEYCLDHSIGHVIPTIDPELPIYAASKSRFEEHGITVWVSEPATIKIAQDKRETNRWLLAHGFPAPAQLDLFAAIEGDLDLPLIAKPARGSSSIGVIRVNESDQLRTLDSSLDYVLESIALGTEFTVDVLVDEDGQCRVAVPRQRIETRAGEVSKGITVDNAELAELACAVADALPGSFGPLNVQIFHDADSGSLCIIEINARFGGGFPLTWAAGARLPTWLLQKLSGQAPNSALLQWEPGTLMLRYDAAQYLHLGRDGMRL